MTAELSIRIPTCEDARAGTDRLKAAVKSGERLWRQAYAEEWWRLLDYPSWNAYCVAELEVTTRQARYYVTQAKAEAVEGGNVSARQARRILSPVETVDAVVADLTSRPPSNRPGVASDAAPGSEEESTSTPPLPGPEAGDESVSGLEEVEPRIVITWPGGTFDVDAPSPHITAAMWREVAAFCAERARLCELNLEPTPEPQRPNNLPTSQQFDLISAVLRAEKERVWTVAELRKQTGLPTATIRNALVWLEENEYDVEKRGKGFVVKGDAA